ncbi:phage holin family protein [Chromobacterium sphagni]|uniref:Phage holin family protein n=1 Tax=Chromobacterium sphagni TaxID=1903179 RepID=A0A1S1X0V6_9NEIS|nr:phage holin family protein [Chromobacterium sphagni]OHX13163.1 hypothetical protein BI347_06345 [Chromobacterium sphagni]OHX21041.1 hypothetical protein BI344_00340 [Chromobacterium sphagni]
MSEKQHSHHPGSLSSFADGVVSLLLTRAELLTLEAQELKDEILANLFSGMLALILLAIGLLATLFLLWILTPVAFKAWAMASMALLFIGGSLLLLWQLRRRLLRQGPAFALTIQELRKDWGAMSGQEPK